jgi:hypothetical protein
MCAAEAELVQVGEIPPYATSRWSKLGGVEECRRTFVRVTAKISQSFAKRVPQVRGFRIVFSQRAVPGYRFGTLLHFFQQQRFQVTEEQVARIALE